MEGLIRKIIVGRDPKNGMAYYVGMKTSGGNVSSIIQDDRYLHVNNKIRYIVYLQTDEGQVPWKSIDDMPCIVEYDQNF